MHCLRTSGADLPDEDAGRIRPVCPGEEWEHGVAVGAESLVVAEEEAPGHRGLAAERATLEAPCSRPAGVERRGPLGNGPASVVDQ
jgi:hypothetical protein